MLKDYSVYCHTTPSGRKYVGISCNPVSRWDNGRGYAKNYLFDRAIKKYGWDNITHEILYEGLSLDEAKEIEKKLIVEWNLTDAQYGMNLSGGGDGILSDETRKRMSKANLGNKRSVGRKYSEETKQKISNSLKNYFSCHETPFKGRHHSEETIQKLKNRVVSEETKQKMRQNHANVSGANNPSAKAVIQLSLDDKVIKEYPYAKLASDELHIDLSAIIACCRGRKKTCGGYRWKYAINKEV